MDAFIGRLTQATPEEAAVLLDQGFSLADSLSCADPQSMALYWFADELASRLDGVGSPTRDARLFSMALDRQQQCASLEPDDWRRITFFRERLALNSPGFAVSDIAAGVYPFGAVMAKELRIRQIFRQGVDGPFLSPNIGVPLPRYSLAGNRRDTGSFCAGGC